MRRRDFLVLLGGAVIAPAGGSHLIAQEAGKTPRIGYLSPSSPSAGLNEAFRQGLRDLGYIDGKNLIVEYRFADGNFERLTALAAELVELKVDVIVAVVTQASLAAKSATSTIPIVMVAVSDPVGSGLVNSLARPGSNITGTSSMSADVVGKALELMREAVPEVSYLAVLWNRANAVFQAQMLRQAEDAAARLGVKLERFGVLGPEEFDRTFAGIAKSNAGALIVLADPMLILHQKRIIELVESTRLPAMYTSKDYAMAGGLMSFGPNMLDQSRRAAGHVHKILEGINPADLPVEQPTMFELVINLKTAKALGFVVPPTLLARADEVIE